jgi:hypothetical protein
MLLWVRTLRANAIQLPIARSSQIFALRILGRYLLYRLELESV